MRPPRGVDGSSPDRWHPNRPDAQRLWLSQYRSARQSHRLFGHPLKVPADLPELDRRLRQWAIDLAFQRSRPDYRPG